MTIEPSTSVQNVKDRVLETRAVQTDLIMKSGSGCQKRSGFRVLKPYGIESAFNSSGRAGRGQWSMR